MATATNLLTRVPRKLRNLRLVDQRKGFELIEVQTLKDVISSFDVDCIFDVGANAGQYATLLRQKVGYKGLIVSFEPLPAEVATLRRKASDKWLIEPIALSDSDGAAQFNASFGSEFSSLSQPTARASSLFSGAAVTRETLEVRTERLETAFHRLQSKLGFRRPFLKLDTQGFDHRIIMAGQNVLSAFVGFQTELSVRPLYETARPYLDALEDYEGLGFRPCAFFPNNFGHFPDLHELDCILLRMDLQG